VTKPAFCLTFFFSVAASLPAQQVASATLPDAPSHLLSTTFSSSIDATVEDDQQTPAPAQPTAQTPQDPQKDAATAAQPAQQTDEQRHAEGEREVKAQTQQRMLGIVPAFNEVIGGTAVPLTPKQKFKLFLVGSVDPYQFVIAGLDAGIEQAQDTYPEYHFGIQGYSRRYAASFFDNWDGNFWGNAVLPSLLKQDPRYFRLGHGSPIHRIVYTALSTVRAKGDNGKWQPNYSNVAGNFIGGAVSNFYYPQSDRGIELTLERGFTVTVEGVLGALAEEFYPDLAGMMQRRKARKDAAKEAAAPATSTPAPATPAP